MLTFPQVIKDLKTKVYAPIYFLHGHEPYYIDKISHYIENHVLDDGEKSFNQTIAYGRESDLGNIIGKAKQFPMMANHQVIIVREAQDLKNLLPKKSGEEKDTENPFQEKLLKYIENPQTSTLLVFCCKYSKLNKNGKVYKALVKNKAVIFESVPLYENQLPKWIFDYTAEKKYKIQTKAAQMLADYLGNNLEKIANELGKVFLNIPPGSEIQPADIEKYIGISKDFNVFEFQEALGQRDSLKAFAIARYFGSNKKENPLVMIIGSLYGYFSKLLKYQTLQNKSASNVAAALGISPFFIEKTEKAARNYSSAKLIQVIHQIGQADLKAKGILPSDADDGEILQELVSKII